MLYDEKCDELAGYFLNERFAEGYFASYEAYRDARKQFAVVIQTAVEDWMEFRCPKGAGVTAETP